MTTLHFTVVENTSELKSKWRALHLSLNLKVNSQELYQMTTLLFFTIARFSTNLVLWCHYYFSWEKKSHIKIYSFMSIVELTISLYYVRGKTSEREEIPDEKIISPPPLPPRHSWCLDQRPWPYTTPGPAWSLAGTGACACCSPLTQQILDKS